eukprot:403334253
MNIAKQPINGLNDNIVHHNIHQFTLIENEDQSKRQLILHDPSAHKTPDYATKSRLQNQHDKEQNQEQINDTQDNDKNREINNASPFQHFYKNDAGHLEPLFAHNNLKISFVNKNAVIDKQGKIVSRNQDNNIYFSTDGLTTEGNNTLAIPSPKNATNSNRINLPTDFNNDQGFTQKHARIRLNGGSALNSKYSRGSSLESIGNETGEGTVKESDRHFQMQKETDWQNSNGIRIKRTNQKKYDYNRIISNFINHEIQKEGYFEVDDADQRDSLSKFSKKKKKKKKVKKKGTSNNQLNQNSVIEDESSMDFSIPKIKIIQDESFQLKQEYKRQNIQQKDSDDNSTPQLTQRAKDIQTGLSKIIKNQRKQRIKLGMRLDLNEDTFQQLSSRAIESKHYEQIQLKDPFIKKNQMQHATLKINMKALELHKLDQSLLADQNHLDTIRKTKMGKYHPKKQMKTINPDSQREFQVSELSQQTKKNKLDEDFENMSTFRNHIANPLQRVDLSQTPMKGDQQLRVYGGGQQVFRKNKQFMLPPKSQTPLAGAVGRTINLQSSLENENNLSNVIKTTPKMKVGTNVVANISQDSYKDLLKDQRQFRDQSLEHLNQNKSHIQKLDLDKISSFKKQHTRNFDQRQNGFISFQILSKRNFQSMLLSQKYQKSIDVISIYSQPIYICNGPENIIYLNKVCNLTHITQYTQGVSDEARDLLFKLLEKNPKKRISPRDALLHPWFKADQEALEVAIQLNSQIKVQSVQRYTNITTTQIDQNNQEAHIKCLDKQQRGRQIENLFSQQSSLSSCLSNNRSQSNQNSMHRDSSDKEIHIPSYYDIITTNRNAKSKSPIQTKDSMGAFTSLRKGSIFNLDSGQQKAIDSAKVLKNDKTSESQKQQVRRKTTNLSNFQLLDQRFPINQYQDEGTPKQRKKQKIKKRKVQSEDPI